MSSFYFRKDAQGAARWARENGFEGLEIWADVPFFNIDEVTSKDLRELNLAGGGIGYSLHSPIYGINLSCVNPGILRESLRQIEKALEWSDVIKIERLIIHPGSTPSSSPGIRKRVRSILSGSLSRLADLARGKGVELLLENVGISELDMCTDISEFCEVTEEHGLRCCLDAGHANIRWGGSAALRTLAHLTGQIHVHDNHGDADLHLAAGDGSIEWGVYRPLLGLEDVIAVHEVKDEADPCSAVLRSREFLDNCST